MALNEKQIDDLILIHGRPLNWNRRRDLTDFKRQVIEETIACLEELKARRKSASVPVEGVVR